jgi:lipopolysaccharide/colanic/teichoic acid biosynthesis glycosyltransferase
VTRDAAGPRPYDIVKRSLDVAVSLVALIVLSPIMIVIAILVRVLLGSPILFRQVRPGWNERPFTLIKFRTMRDSRGADGQLLPDEDRLTRFGAFLRSTSADELPELWNVLVGDMSLVGPRPLLLRYLDYYTDEERARHLVRPGLTGLAQISGRNALSWEEKFSLDVEYVRTYSFALDLSILLRTLRKVTSREGILAKAPQGALHEYRKDLRR